ncbi:hypothetical protein [Chitinivibrio alkaliphilus]|uniref:DUF5723 domain-containing protein n=1 Tax=Chitinivibrio alkaliphilus ACht1 TaxID=1313304 RepID=U7DB76_9BACT|nr:hypothetical protein [Chitinivibrio alkaliphilus]ERP38803.1 hypothetical protein CALK_0573 [Chitinivibrio alkaliphilus ACht1]
MYLIFLLLFLCSVSVHGRDYSWAGRSGFQFLRRPVSISSSGMGGGGTADVSDFTRYINPALAGDMEGPELNMAFGNTTFQDNLRFSGEMAFPFGSYFFGITMLNHRIDDIYLTGDLQSEVPTVSTAWQSSDFSVTAGVNRNRYFRWAVSLGGAFEEFDGYRAGAFVASAGTQVRLLEEQLLLGFSALNLGQSTSFLRDSTDLGDGEDLPRTFRAGAAWRTSLGEVRVQPFADIVYYHTYDPDDGVRENISDRVFYPLGLVVTPVEWMRLRVGKNLGHETDLVAFGTTLQADYLSARLAFAVQDFDGARHMEWNLGVGFDIGGFAQQEK